MSRAAAPHMSSEDFVPGTIHLVDAARDVDARHGSQQERDIVLHPKPSDHVDDPLNWTHRRKLLSTLCMFVYAMTIAISSAAIYSVLEPISEATNLSVADLNAGTGYMHRLWLLLPLVIISPGSQLLWGLGAYYKVQWMGPIIAMGFISFATVVGAQICYSYCIDSYRALSGEAIVTVILLRNNMLFGINYGITPWIDNMGLRNAYILAACIAFVQVLTFLFMTKFGKRLRAMTVKPYRNYCAVLEADGLLH